MNEELAKTDICELIEDCQNRCIKTTGQMPRFIRATNAVRLQLWESRLDKYNGLEATTRAVHGVVMCYNLPGSGIRLIAVA